MALESIKATASQAVSDAVDQAYAQGAADAKAGGSASEGEVTSPAPVSQIDVAKLVANAYNEGVVAENKRMTTIVEEAIAANDSTEKLLRQRMQITVPSGTPEEIQANA